MDFPLADLAVVECLPVQHPWAWALGACLTAAVLEGVMSGTRVKQRFAELTLPPPAFPLWAWSIIGVGYYILFFFVLNYLLGSAPTPGWTPAAIALVAVLLVANAVWNFVFFRIKNVWLSFVFFAPYVFAALLLALVLLRLHSPLLPWYLIYAAYLGYATWWGYSVWRLNRNSLSSRKTNDEETRRAAKPPRAGSEKL